MTKQAIVILLTGLNALLLAVLLLVADSPPPAYAQATPLGQNYAMVAAEIRDGVDGLYVVDLSSRRLHVFIPNRNQASRSIIYVGYRDLQKEFRGR